jgi:HTTM domain
VSRLARWWASLFDEVGSLRGVALARLLFGPIVVFNLWGYLTDALDGQTYQDRFHHPFWSWLPHLPEPVYGLVILAGVAAGAAMTVGFLSRVATTTAFLVVTYNLLVDQTGFQHNRAFLVMNLGLLALQPTGLALSVDAWRHERRTGRPPDDRGLLWPLWLQRLLLASVYLASATSKLSNPDWRSGLVLWDRVVRYSSNIEALPHGDALAGVLTDRWVYWWFAPVVLGTELFIGLGLWGKRTRLAAIWVAVAFHASIQVTAEVNTFSFGALAALAVWAVPRTRDRTVIAPARAAAAIGALDWLARFHVEVAEPGGGFRLVDRDGRRWAGIDARRRVLLRLPLTFWFIAPVVALTRGRSEVEGPVDRPATMA